MTANFGTSDKMFKRAMFFSLAAHTALFLIILANPSLPKPSKKGMIHYISLNMVGLPGVQGGGGGGRGGLRTDSQTTLGTTEIKKESLRDLTTLEKLQEEPKSSLRYPVDKPKKEPTPKPNKKAAITKQDAEGKKPITKGTTSTSSSTGAESGTGRGAGLTIGAGGPGFGEGTGSAFTGQIGLSNFPFTYYVQAVRDKISSNWFTSLVDPGVSGTLQAAVYFRIFRNGTISTVDIRESSGVKTFDFSAVRAVMNSAPFPPLPSEYEEEYLGVILIFEHTK